MPSRHGEDATQTQLCKFVLLSWGIVEGQGLQPCWRWSILITKDDKGPCITWSHLANGVGGVVLVMD